MTEQLQTIARGKEQSVSPEQQQFHEAWQREAARATQAEKLANQQARDNLKNLNAVELRNIGFKQVLWGTGLSILNGIGAGIGALGGFGVWTGTSWLAVSAASAGSVFAGALGVASVVSIGAIPLGLFGGAVAGAEVTRYVYNKFVRKVDTSLPKLDKTDRVAGDLFALSGFGNAPLVAGVRNIFEGFSQMKALQ